VIGVVIPVHGSIDSILSLLESLSNQKKSNLFKVIVVYSGNHSNYLRLNLLKPKNFEFSAIEVESSSYWARSIWEGVKVFISELECSHILFMNDDIYIDSNLIANFEMLSKVGVGKNVYFSPVFDVDKEHILSGTLNVYFSHFLIMDNLNLSQIKSNISDLATGRCTMYPIEFFLDGGRIHYTLFPHHYADLDLSRQAKKLGYSLLCDLQLKIFSKNDFSSSVHFGNFFKRYFHVKSPDRLISWFSFWTLYAKTIVRVSLIQYILIVLRNLISKARNN